ncbi:MAG: hypothetical protein FWD69_14490 [Polyangiaceae bacterium]|nr:hypothetical protein [Polyangiaceae bacterium]
MTLTFDVNGDGDEPVVSFTSPSPSKDHVNDHVSVNETAHNDALRVLCT